MNLIPAVLIRKKRDGLELSREELFFMVNGCFRGEIPDYQMAALLMAITLRGLQKKEAGHLTDAMLKSGQQVSFTHTKYPAVDKHSTGGIGDKTSLLIAPIVAACGVPVPMIAGRGLGHTGGTLDKMEAIPGFNIQLSLQSFQQQVSTLGCALIGQTAEICPADKKMYALRDVTGTVESIGLICASILSKKIAEGICGLVMDVKTGSGAFMKTLEDAQELARWLVETAALNHVQTVAYVTQMNQPLGRFVGNAIEVLECLSLFENKSVMQFSPQDFSDTRELSLVLSAEMLVLAQRCSTYDEAHALAEKTLTSGQAYEMFCKMVTAQGGRLSEFQMQPASWETVAATQDGFVETFNAEDIGYATISLGAGRLKTSDAIDHQASLIVHKKIGDAVKKGETLFSFTSRTQDKNSQAHQFLTKSCKISLQKVPAPSLILGRVDNLKDFRRP